METATQNTGAKAETAGRFMKKVRRYTRRKYTAEDKIRIILEGMFNPRNQTRFYRQCIPLYDFHITTKSYNVSEFEKAGAKKALFIDNAFCEFTHKPPTVSDSERKYFGGPVGFIGTYEKQRAKSLQTIADAGIKVKIWGNWPHGFRYPNLEIMNKPLFGQEYTKAIYSFDINLCFLRKENRDLQTTRSIEIPACGGFMFQSGHFEYAFEIYALLNLAIINSHNGNGQYEL